MSELAQVTVSDHEGITVTSISGEIDISNAVQVKAAVLRSVDNHSAGMVLDLMQTTYLDSAAVSLLFELADRLRQRGQQIRVVISDGSPIRTVLEITGVDQVAPFVADTDVAVAEIRRVP